MAAVVVVLVAVVLITDDGDAPRTQSAAGTGPTTTAEIRPTTTLPRTTTTGPTTAGPDGATVPATQPTPACRPEVVVAGWPLRRRLAALVSVGVDPSSTTEATVAVQTHHVGGIFVGGNDPTLLTDGALVPLRENEPLGLMVSVDEEGGRVQRIEMIHGDVPSARDMAATMTTDEVRALALERGRQMAALGVNVDLAPVVDVSDQPDGTVIGDRSFSDDPAQVVAYAGAYADGLLETGVIPVLKHFPGHGSASGDTHQGAATTPDLASLRQRDLVPYTQLLPVLGARTGVMLGHLTVPGLTEAGTPSSLSPATVRLLRDELGFTGVIMTDDLGSMGAITQRFGPAEAAIRALVAGVDMVLYAAVDVPGLLDALEQAVADGRLPEAQVDASVLRTLALKGIDACQVVL